MAGRPIIAFASWLLLAGGILFQFFLILSGAVGGNPEPHFWFLSADTRGIDNAPAFTAWTFFAICSVPGLGGSETTNSCRGAKAALPLDPPGNFGTERNIPPSFIGTHHYYYLSRFAFAFYLIALFFSVIALFSGGLALCTRLGSYLTGMTVAIAFFFQALASALMTAWVVQGQKAFQAGNRPATIGRYSMGFSWAAVFAFLISMVMFCAGGSVGKQKSRTPKSRFGPFGRKRSTRSRGSFYGSGSDSGRVKEDYA